MSQSEIQVAAWRYATILGAANVPRPAYFDNPVSLFAECNFDVTTTLSATGVTETVTNFVVASATILTPATYTQSGVFTNVSAVVVLSA